MGELSTRAKSRKVSPNPLGLGCRFIYLPVLSRSKVGGATGRRRRDTHERGTASNRASNLGAKLQIIRPTVDNWLMEDFPSSGVTNVPCASSSFMGAERLLFFSSDVETLEKFQKQFSRRYNGGDKNIRIWKRFELKILYLFWEEYSWKCRTLLES